jgi:hypothetical protein
MADIRRRQFLVGAAGPVFGLAATRTAPASETTLPSISASQHAGDTRAVAAEGVVTRGNAINSLSAMLGSNGDAIDNIGYGGKAPSGTDYTSAIQSAINTLARNSTGGGLIWDGAWALSACLLIPSNFTIWAPNKDCGAILRSGANCSMFRNRDCLANDASSNLQNSWGKINPRPGGDQRFRVLNASSFANKNIAIIGGTWNCNRSAQGVGPANVFSTVTGPHCNFQFYGVDGLTLSDFTAYSSQVFNIHTANVQNVIAKNLILDQSPASRVGVGNWQCEGPAAHIRVTNIQTHASADDNIAFNADDGGDAMGKSLFGSSYACGTNWSCSGDITDVVVDGLVFTRGQMDLPNAGGLRLLSTVARLDNITIKLVSGNTTGQGFILTNFQNNTLIPGAGNFGRITFEDISVAFSSPAGGADQKALFNIDAQIEMLTVKGRKIVSPPNVEDVWIGNASGGGLDYLSYEATLWTPSTWTNYAQPVILVGGHVSILRAKVDSYRDGSFKAAATPIVRTTTNANIPIILDIECNIDRALNIVDHAAGTINTVRISGTHTNANGGRPLSIAAGLTVKNGIHNDLAHVGSFKSGAGTLANDSTSSFAAGNNFAD